MNRIKTIIICSFLILTSIYFITYLHNDWKSNEISENDLEYFESDINYINETTIGGKRPSKIIYFKINGSTLTFRILGIPFEILEDKKMISEIKTGKLFRIGVNKNYTEKFQKNLKNKILNQIIGDRINPNIYYLKNGELEIITINEFNKLDKVRRTNNFWLGTLILSLFIIINTVILFLNYKEMRKL
jgi:hypothetical protein